jgi:arylsulfatase A-like enzyme
MASIMTSQDPARHGVRGVEDGLPDWLTTLAGELAGGGYHTIGVNTNPWLKARFGFDAGFAVYETLGFEDGSFPRGTRVSRAALDLVEEAPHGRPVFLYVHYMDVHAPYRPPAEFYSAPPLSGPRGVAIPDDRLELLYRKRGLAAPGVQQRVLDLYDGEIRAVDAAIGELLEGLERVRGSRDTIRVVTSDHGESFREHGTTEHGWNLYPEVYEIPLLFHAPWRLPSGVTIEEQVRGIDVAPTLLSLAGIGVPESFEGEPLLPMKPGAIRDRVATGAVGLNDYLPNLDYVAVVTPSSLYVRERRNDRVEFYDLEADPGALDDLGPDHPRARILAKLAPASGDTKASRESLDPETIEQLRSLGYIE